MTYPYLYLDMETQNDLSVVDVGASLYAEHPSNHIMCLCFVDVDGKEYSITADYGKPIVCDLLQKAAADPNIIFVAHNVAFERAQWRNAMVPQGYPDIPLDRWKCTMAKCRAHGLPCSLERAAEWLNLPVKKDMEGNKAMRILSRPKKHGGFYTYDEEPILFEQMYSYCMDDVRAEKYLDEKLKDLIPAERQIWQIDQRMNSTGIQLDLPFVHKANGFAKEAMARQKDRFRELTGINPTQRKKFSRFIGGRLYYENSDDTMVVYDDEIGPHIKDTRRPTMEKLLNRRIPEDVKEAIEIFLESNLPSLAKYEQMITRSDANGVSRENNIYGAAHTLRWGGGGINFFNMKRPDIDIDACIDYLMQCDTYEEFQAVYPNVANALSSCCRGAVVASPGHRLFVADYSQMEAVMLLWLAGQEDKLEMIRDGKDLYCMQAPSIYGHEIDKEKDKDKRFVCKVAVLALGYAGGISAFAKMADVYGLDLRPLFKSVRPTVTDDELQRFETSYILYRRRCQDSGDDAVDPQIALVADIVKQRWRAGNANIAAYWKELERTAIEAVETGVPVICGRGTWFTHSIFLIRKLANGRNMFYPFPKVSIAKNGKKSLSYQHNQKGRISTHGGTLCENETQANQRELLAHSHIRLEPIYPVALHVYDENVASVPDTFGSLDDFKSIMRETPRGYEGLPINVSGWEGYRYGKR